MRVHSLELTAFGPFATTQRLDFAELNQAGLFLLSGPTGAGKTSVLDAICFALYGSVPGDRGSAKDLKSHHAADDVAPVVEVDVSIRGRRFRVRRSPAWSRPSTRARSGVAERPAQARLSEWGDGEWRQVSGRIDEIGHLLTGLLGMTRDQFCQVVLLPQGKFQTFLSAGAKERHDVLETLFETGRFKRIETWLADERRSRDAALDAQRARLAELAARIDEANGGPLADAGDDALPHIDRRTLDALTEVCHRLTAAVASAQTTFDASHEAAKQAQHELDEAKALLERQARHREARQAIDELDATADRLADRERRVDLARSAAAVVPLADAADRAHARLARLLDDAAALRDSLAEAGVTVAPGAAGAIAAADGLRTRLAAVDALRPLAAEVASEGRRRRELADRLRQVEHDLADAVAALAAADDTPADDHAITALRAQAALLDETASRVRRAESTLDAAREVAVLELAASTAQTASSAARSAALDAREAWLTARERRLASSAAILAAELADGAACPVCGSLDHPAPAEAGDEHVGADEEQAALARLAALDAEAEAAAAASADVDRRLALARGRAAGVDVAAAETALAEAERSRESAAAAAARVEVESERLRRLRESRDALAAAVNERTARAAEATARLDEATKALRRKERRLRASIGPGETVDALAADLAVRLHACAGLAETETAAADVRDACAEHDGRLVAALGDTPFASSAEVRGAVMTQPEIANAEALNRAARAARAAAERALADPVLTAAALLSPPDLDALQARVDAAHADLMAASGAVDRHTDRLARLERLGDQLEVELDALAPIVRARDVAASVATMCAGTSPDNQTRTRLSHYVLSERLRQVVEAANERLAGIASGRYELLHTMDRGVGDARGGLSLRVHDAHTGRTRDPATLSGGEGFFVSLALALGLAELVRDEVGGLELNTLFVDEGFGMLDAETLDEVMDELDSLRAGGRAVGIVSHLHELRLRIPAHVEVVPSPSGSVIGPL